MIRICLFTLATLIASSYAQAQDMSNWSDKTVCRLIASQSDNDAYQEEAERRKLDCSALGTKKPTSSSNTKQQPTTKISTEPGIQIYDVALKPADKERLLSTPLSKTEFDFSAYRIAQHADTITCSFDLRRVVYENKTEGEMENWNIANGVIRIENGKVNLKSGRWNMGGLSSNPSYLRDEINLRLTDKGHLVGKMAYFHLNIDSGEAPMAPLYIELAPHQRSTALDYKNLPTTKAEIWIDVEDWAGGVLLLRYCR
ncbi:MAG: hypothetical protein QGG88_10395 [Gammaproteobacteria bacterium]|jgi:hypothetical protein|nr:hypothetical protein [Gammaproteobacteria bacterium]